MKLVSLQSQIESRFVDSKHRGFLSHLLESYLIIGPIITGLIYIPFFCFISVIDMDPYFGDYIKSFEVSLCLSLSYICPYVFFYRGLKRADEETKRGNWNYAKGIDNASFLITAISVLTFIPLHFMTVLGITLDTFFPGIYGGNDWRY